MPEKMKKLISDLQNKGIPLFFIRDYKSGQPSVSLTFFVISSLVVLIGLIGKYSNYLDIDMKDSLYWNGMCAALYFGRNVSGNGPTIVDSK